MKLNRMARGVIATAVLCSTAMLAQARETLYLFNWTEYMDPALITAFEQRYDVDVVQSYYGSLGELYARLQSGGDSQFDLVVPSNYYIPRLISGGLVQPIDRTKLPHLNNLNPSFTHPAYDPELRYSVPYLWGTTGLVYDIRDFPQAPDSWSLLFDPQQNPRQPFALQNDGSVMIAAACAWQHHGSGCNMSEAWAEAAKLLLQTKKRANFTGFVDGTSVLPMLARGVDKVAISYNGDFLNAKQSDPESFKYLRYVIPKEGSEMWVDSMMIPAHAPHPALAHKFIDFMLEAENGARLANWTWYSSPNQAAMPLLDPALRESPSLPTDDEMKRLELLPVQQSEQLTVFQEIWNEVRSR